MAPLELELATYDGRRHDLEAGHTGKWVLIKGSTLVGTFESFDVAAEEAVRQFGSGPYLIRQIGAPPVILPASVAFF